MKDAAAIIMAAGRGKRLGDFTKDKSKVLLEVGGKSLIEHAIGFIRNLGIKDIVVVAGYCFAQVESAIKKIDPSIKVVENHRYDLQNLLSFAKGLSQVDNADIFVYDADLIFRKENLEKVKADMRGISVYCSYDLSGNSEDTMKVKADSQNNLVEMSKNLADFNCVYAGMFFVESGYIPVLKEIVSDMLDKCDKKEARVEWIFKALKDKGYLIKVRDMGRSDWIEIDTREDFRRAQKIIKTF